MKIGAIGLSADHSFLCATGELSCEKTTSLMTALSTIGCQKSGDFLCFASFTEARWHVFLSAVNDHYPLVGTIPIILII